MIQITAVRHAYPEKAGFVIDRKTGHPDYTFLHFITPIQMEVEGALRAFPAHTVMLYAPGTPQYFCSDDLVVHDWMHLSGEVAPLLVRYGIATDRPIFPMATDFITAILRELEAEFFGNGKNRDALSLLKLEELFLKLGRMSEAAGTVLTVDKGLKGKMRALRGSVFRDLERKWTIGEMAESVHLSPSRFQVVYKSLYGISPMRDLIGARVDAAQKLLLSTSLSVSHVAAAVGYDNVYHFIRQFKESVGVTPLVYRKAEHETMK